MALPRMLAAVALLGFLAPMTLSQDRMAPEAGKAKSGLVLHERGAFEGYSLFAPIRNTSTYLIDMQGKTVHTWESDSPPGHSVFLLENGNLLRSERVDGEASFRGGGAGGRIREYAPDGKVAWEFVYANDRHMQHHDIEPLPNGNVLLVAWEKKTKEEAIAAGRDPALMQGEEFWPDHLVEVEPKRPAGGTVMWEWRVWDHLVQDHDPKKANHGVVADHPERIDINGNRGRREMSPQERRRLEALGYLPPQAQQRGKGRRGPEGGADFNHINSVSYDAELDQIVLSVHQFHEIWVIDHGTTTEEAAGPAGDLLYRWGNPRACGRGTAEDQRFFGQHDARWIVRKDGGRSVLVFNNGSGRPDGSYSSVEEIVLPIDKNGRYERPEKGAFGPSKPAWVYTASRKEDLYSGFISGAERLPNGNTLICSGADGRFLEVTAKGKTVWEYANPFVGDASLMGRGGRRGVRGGPPMGGPPMGGPPMRPPDGEGRGGRGGGPGRGPGGMGDTRKAVFRVNRLAPDHSGVVNLLKAIAASNPH